MPNFRNLKELERYMNRLVLKESMEEVGKKIEGELKDEIDKVVYDAYSPNFYDRTYELRDSVTSETYSQSETVFTKIGHDYDKIHPNADKYQHTSVWGDDVSEYLPQWINDGTIGLAFGKGLWTEPRPYMDNTKERIKDGNLFAKELKQSLKKRGIKTD